MKDTQGTEIHLGDTLRSEWIYDVIVVEDPDTHEWVGKLVCEPGDSCENIPYHLNNGKGYTVVRPGVPQ